MARIGASTQARGSGPEAYYAANPDVAAAEFNPLAHYLMYGRGEGRALTPEAAGVRRPRPLPPLPRRMLQRLRGLLRPGLGSAQVLQPTVTDGFIDSAMLRPVSGHLPTGWVLLHLPPSISRLSLRLMTDSGMCEMPLPAGPKPSAALVRLPDAPAAIALAYGARGGTGMGFSDLPAYVLAREIGPLEARLRLLCDWPGTLGEFCRQLGKQGPRRVLDALAREHSPGRIGRYQEWIDHYDAPPRLRGATMRARSAAMQDAPQFSVIVPTFNTTASALRDMIGSVRAQLYPHWQLCIADDASTAPHVRSILTEAAAEEPRIRLALRERNGNIAAASNSALELATGDFAALLDHDDLIPPHALLAMAEAIKRQPRVDLLYSDEDKLDAEGRRYGPYFKPDYSPELLQGQNVISHLGVYRLSTVRALGGFREGFDGSQDYDLALRVAARTSHPIVHVPHVLYHWRVYAGAQTFSSTQIDRASAAARRAIREQAE